MKELVGYVPATDEIVIYQQPGSADSYTKYKSKYGEFYVLVSKENSRLKCRIDMYIIGDL